MAHGTVFFWEEERERGSQVGGGVYLECATLMQKLVMLGWVEVAVLSSPTPPSNVCHAFDVEAHCAGYPMLLQSRR